MRILSPVADASTDHGSEKKSDRLANESVGNTNPTTSKIPSKPAGTPPIVVLDTDVVSHNMAARLCVSFLGHILFLKNQISFPIVQLAKMPTSENTRAAKKRQELLNSFDTLASHLYTTFVALSTALALRGSLAKAEVNADTALQRAGNGVGKVFFAVALGPTVGTAKSHVIVGIDKLETKVWGSRQDDVPNNVVRTNDVSEDESDDHVKTASESDEEVDSEDEECEEETSEANGEEEEASESGDDASPPPSRSPSPTDSDSLSSVSPPSVASKVRSEDPEAVRAAERLLSRTLASACAEDDGQGLASEMAPTQIHVLLRAPRRFDHPSWIPRQNLCASLDGYLADFLAESGEIPAFRDSNKKRPKMNKVQGLWIKSNGNASIEASESALAEEDELIWWSWDGKLVGFADW